ncbi:hypothetical protein MANES_04G164100v8 [Manihot esculenta]|uniref:Uncharacterized protein n=1 Tax=Manihot esculenta TaxID=3983 RepID=A0ACB7HXM0_MANES|nr:hypothetical protein MANES_04G164100v8 [Manihot esculenta]
MEPPSSSSWVPKLFFIAIVFFFPYASSSSLHPLVVNSTVEHRNYTGISSFRVVNRRALLDCPWKNPYLQVTVKSSGNYTLSNEEFVSVTVSGVLHPSSDHWVAMISPSNSDVGACPLNEAGYLQTGDLSNLPLLCHYPVKAAFMSNDPDYLSCKKKECKKHHKKKCAVTTCTATLKFHIINIRTHIEFVLFAGGFDDPCVLARSTPLKFSNPNTPLYAHISTTDSTATSMRVTWVSGSNEPQYVQYGNGSVVPSPAKDFGWHDPGYIHSAVMTGLNPSSKFSYRYGSDSVGWSDQIQFKTPPAAGSNELRFLAFGDMGKAPRDASTEHYIQPGSISVVDSMIEEVKSGNVDSIFHIGDISYATGFLVEWDFFLHLISPLASKVPYMTAIGNHERDYIGTGVVYGTPDSGGECGVAYETYFPMPTPAKDKPWYSIEQGSVHFTVISTEHDWAPNSEQYQWMRKDMASVDRKKTPWLIFTGHRPMYSSDLLSVDPTFVAFVEPLLQQYKVDLVFFGHVHNYERSCSVYRAKCLAMPTKDTNGVETYDHNNYKAPVHAIIGMAGFTLDNFSEIVPSWSLKRVSKFGYGRVHATQEELKFELVNSNTRQAEDSFRIIKKAK